MARRFPFSLLVAVLGLWLLSPGILAQDSGVRARPDPALKATLERAYGAWRAAMAAGDLDRWKEATAFSRQISIRNRIVSQKLPFPEALFNDPLGAPGLEGLFSLGVLSTGETATSTYYGKANFGGTVDAVTDNLIVLHFLREEGTWRFDTLRVIKTGGDAEILLKIRNSDFSFLQGEEFQPADSLPPVPQPVERPDYVAEAWIDATGYELVLEVNGRLTGRFPNARGAELVIGGLNRGQNSVRIRARRLPEAAAENPRVEVAIYAAGDPSDQAKRVYHFRPGATVPPETTETFVVN